MAGPSQEPPTLGPPPPPVVTKFDASSVPSFYLCRICEAHIADPRDIVCTVRKNTLVFRHAINSIDSVDPSRKATLDVRCIQCNKILGYTWNLDKIMRDGQVFLFLTSLWFWDGQCTIDPVTGDVFPPPRQQPPPLSPPPLPPQSPPLSPGPGLY